MTLTNHITRIGVLCDNVTQLADRRHYEEAHSALDDIIKRANLIHEHLDNLQGHAAFAFAGESEVQS